MMHRILIIILALTTAVAAFADTNEKIVYTRVWPSEAPVQTCYDAAGRQYNTAGKNSATWFNYGGSGNWKIFDINPEEPLLIIASGDS